MRRTRCNIYGEVSQCREQLKCEECYCLNMPAFVCNLAWRLQVILSLDLNRPQTVHPGKATQALNISATSTSFHEYIYCLHAVQVLIFLRLVPRPTVQASNYEIDAPVQYFAHSRELTHTRVVYSYLRTYSSSPLLGNFQCKCQAHRAALAPHPKYGRVPEYRWDTVISFPT